MDINEILRNRQAVEADRAEDTRRRNGASSSRPGRGRQGTSGHKGISERKGRRPGDPGRYQVFSKVTPQQYIGTAASIEAALALQAVWKPDPNAPDCSGHPGIHWSGSSIRARVVVRGVVFQQKGFTSIEAAQEWRAEVVRRERGDA